MSCRLFLAVIIFVLCCRTLGKILERASMLTRHSWPLAEPTKSLLLSELKSMQILSPICRWMDRVVVQTAFLMLNTLIDESSYKTSSSEPFSPRNSAPTHFTPAAPGKIWKVYLPGISAWGSYLFMSSWVWWESQQNFMLFKPLPYMPLTLKFPSLHE